MRKFQTALSRRSVPCAIVAFRPPFFHLETFEYAEPETVTRTLFDGPFVFVEYDG